jgi:hypothetical protein
MDVNNVLNTLRLWNSGDQNYMLSLHLPKSDAYDNIPGDDKVGVYREPSVVYQPMVFQNTVEGSTAPNDYRAIYYEGQTGKYWHVVDGAQGRAWAEVGKSSIDKVLSDKAYIDMPNASTYWFLDPRRFYFGIKFSFNFTD